MEETATVAAQRITGWCGRVGGKWAPEFTLMWQISDWGKSARSIDLTTDTYLRSFRLSSQEMGVLGGGSWRVCLGGTFGQKLRVDLIYFPAKQDTHFLLAAPISVDLRSSDAATTNEWTGVMAIDQLMMPRLSGADTCGRVMGSRAIEDSAAHLWNVSNLEVNLRLQFVPTDCRTHLTDAQEQPLVVGNQLVLPGLRQTYMSRQVYPQTDVLFFSQQMGHLYLVCHGALLAAHSTVLHDHLRRHAQPHQPTRCTLDGGEFAALKVFVDALYGVEAEGSLAEIAEDVFYLADHFQVGHVRQRCVQALERSLTVHNALYMYAFAQENELVNLRRRAAKVISDNQSKYAGTELATATTILAQAHADNILHKCYRDGTWSDEIVW